MSSHLKECTGTYIYILFITAGVTLLLGRINIRGAMENKERSIMHSAQPELRSYKLLLSADTLCACALIRTNVHTCGTRTSAHVKSNRCSLCLICRSAEIGLHFLCESHRNSGWAFQSHYIVWEILTFPGSSLERGTLRKHLFKDRLCRIEFCREWQAGGEKAEGEEGEEEEDKKLLQSKSIKSQQVNYICTDITINWFWSQSVVFTGTTQHFGSMN